jgi:uncharacterized membrane protein YiaA
MKNKLVLLSIAAILISLIFGGMAWQQLVAENMDEVYLNIAYSTLCLSVAVYIWHMKDEKQNNS